jgi:asparagine synthase (glutamine-hydrolysing)
LELADLLQSGRIVAFPKRLVEWALALRVPAVHLGWESAREFLRLSEAPQAQVAWLHPEFVRRTRRALAGYPPRSPFAPAGRPSFRANLFALEDLRRHISCLAASSPLEPFERRYPYLDRELLEFLYAIPREQLLRPGQRRSLMRRSLRGLVPDEILDRKRKGFLARAPVAALQAELGRLLLETNTMLAGDLHIVEQSRFQRSLRRAAEGQAVPVIPILRTLLVEAWLRHLSEWTECCTLPLFPFASIESRLYTSPDARSSFS